MGSEGALPGVIHQTHDGPVAHDLVDLTLAGPLRSGKLLLPSVRNDRSGS